MMMTFVHCSFNDEFVPVPVENKLREILKA